MLSRIYKGKAFDQNTNIFMYCTNVKLNVIFVEKFQKQNNPNTKIANLYYP